MMDMKKYEEKDERSAQVLKEPAVAYSVGNAEMWNVSLCIPQADMNYLEDLAKVRGWRISSKEDGLEESRRKAIEAFHQMRAAAAATGIEMTLEEINEEIRAARNERRQKNQ